MPIATPQTSALTKGKLGLAEVCNGWETKEGKKHLRHSLCRNSTFGNAKQHVIQLFNIRLKLGQTS